MALLTPLDLASAQALGRQFSVDVASVQPIAEGSVNSNFRLELRDGQIVFGRIYEEQDQIGAAAEARLLAGLSAAGVKTPVPMLASAGSSPEHLGKPFAMYPWISGEDLCLGRITPGRCERLGEALAGVHVASAQLVEIPVGRFGLESLIERLDGIEASSPDQAGVAYELRARVSEYAALRDARLPRGLVHGDLFRDNVLWHGDAIVALLDFESACEGPFVYDLMVCVLAWCYASGFNLEHVAGLVRGYESVRPLSTLERSAAKVEGAIACARFATTRITDFEMRAAPGRPPLRDYRRFIGRLSELEGGALDAIFS